MIYIEKRSHPWLTARRLAAPLLSALTLSGCISSTSPLLGDSDPTLGDHGQIRTYTLSNGSAHDPGVLRFQWSGGRYVVRDRSFGVSDFTVHPYQGRDLIVQSTSTKDPRLVEYALARRLADGTYLIVPINEDDADERTRERFCTKSQDASCRIATPEQLFAFARATADKPIEDGGLAVVVTEDERGARPRR